MKSVIIALLISVSLCSFLPVANLKGADQDKIQLFLNGLFEANDLPDPTTITPCIDDDSAAKIVAFVPVILGQVIDNPADIIGIKQAVEDFGKNLNPAVGQCLDGNAEIETLGAKFCITPGMDTAALERKVATYVSLHLVKVRNALKEIKDDWTNNLFQRAGAKSSDIGHDIVGRCSIRQFSGLESYSMGPNQIILQQALNGVYEDNGLPDPTWVETCVPEPQAKKIVDGIPGILHSLGTASIADLNKVKNQIEEFGKTIDPSVGACLDGNPEVIALASKFGITPTTDKAKLEAKIIAYMTLHALGVQQQFRNIEGLWNSGDYYQSGVKGSDLGHEILGRFKIFRKD